MAKPDRATTCWEVGSSHELPEKGRLVIDLDGVTVGVFRIDGDVYAYENKCPHAGGPVCQGLIVPAVREVLDDQRAIARNAFDESDMRICCPWHGMEFSIKTGKHPASRTLALRKLAVREDRGRIYVDL